MPAVGRIVSRPSATAPLPFHDRCIPLPRNNMPHSGDSVLNLDQCCGSAVSLTLSAVGDLALGRYRQTSARADEKTCGNARVFQRIPPLPRQHHQPSGPASAVTHRAHAILPRLRGVAAISSTYRGEGETLQPAEERGTLLSSVKLGVPCCPANCMSDEEPGL